MDCYDQLAHTLYETNRMFNVELPRWEFVSKKEKGIWYSMAFAAIEVIEPQKMMVSITNPDNDNWERIAYSDN